MSDMKITGTAHATSRKNAEKTSKKPRNWKGYHEEMQKAADCVKKHDNRACYWLGMASEGAEIEAQMAALEGRAEDCARWTLRHLWAEACFEYVPREQTIADALVNGFREGLKGDNHDYANQD